MVAVKFWACSKQSHNAHPGGRLFTGRSKEAGGRQMHPHGRRMDAHGSAISRRVKNAYCCKHCVSIWAMLLPLLYHHCASFVHNSNRSASILFSLHNPLCHYSSFGDSRNAQGSCCSSYTETELSGYGRPLSVLDNFLAQRSQPCVKTALMSYNSYGQSQQKILSQGTSLPSWPAIQEELHMEEW